MYNINFLHEDKLGIVGNEIYYRYSSLTPPMVVRYKVKSKYGLEWIVATSTIQCK